MGKTITYYLIDDDANGRIKCTYSNYTGVVLKLPRKFINDSDDRAELNHSGVYMLVGKDNRIYVGQAIYKNKGNGILTRLKTHLKDNKKDFFTTALAITTTNNSLGATEICYLENMLYNTLKSANICTLTNQLEPTIGNISEEKQSEMDDFLNTAKLMCETLGYFIFSKPKDILENHDDILYFKNAMCKRIENGFLVLKGSEVAKDYKDYAPKGVKKAIENAKVDDNGILLEDMFFNSSSYAAAFITGKNENGLISWKNKSGIPLKELI